MPLPATQSIQHVPTEMTPLAGVGMSGVLSVPGTPVVPASMPVMHSTPSHGRIFLKLISIHDMNRSYKAGGIDTVIFKNTIVRLN